MNESEIETNRQCCIDWEKLNREFDELRENEVKVAQRKAVQKVVKKSVQKAVEEVTKETEEKVRAEERFKQEKEKLDMARNLKSKGVSDEIISESSGLSLEEVKKL